MLQFRACLRNAKSLEIASFYFAHSISGICTFLHEITLKANPGLAAEYPDVSNLISSRQSNQSADFFDDPNIDDLNIYMNYPSCFLCYTVVTPEVGIYEKNQESKKTRKKRTRPENDQEKIKKTRSDQESDQEKEKTFFFS